MPQKPIDQWTADDIRALVTDRAQEDARLEFKEDFPRKLEKDSSKTNLDALDTKEFLADVTSLANTAGGLLVYGIGEERDAEGRPTGVAGTIPGVRASLPPDGECLRIQQRIQAGTEPVLSACSVRAIPGFDNGPVVLVQVPRSWAAPHAVKETGLFHARAGTMKYRMDASTLRRAFIQANDLTAEVRRFHAERLAAIEAGESPVSIEKGPRLVLHVVPVASVENRVAIELDRLRDAPVNPLSWRGGSTGFVLEGFFRYTQEGIDADTHSYALLFRDGRIECVDTYLLARDGPEPLLHATEIEISVHAGVKRHLSYYRQCGVATPAVVLISLLGVRDYKLAVGPGGSHRRLRKIRRDVLRLPEVIVEDFAADPGKALRPAFDAMSREVGLPGSQSYSNGEWDPPG